MGQQRQVGVDPLSGFDVVLRRLKRANVANITRTRQASTAPHEIVRRGNKPRRPQGLSVIDVVPGGHGLN